MFAQVEGYEVYVGRARKHWYWHVPWMKPVTGFATPGAALRDFAGAFEAGRVAEPPS